MAEERQEALIRQYDKLVQYRQKLSDYSFGKELFRFAIFLKTLNESDENVKAKLKSENSDLKRELEALKLHNSTLNSNLKLAHESLNEEKSQRENLEYLSEKLCSLLLKYQNQTCQLEEIKETTTRSFCDDSNSNIEYDSNLVLRIDTSTSGDSLDENNLSDTRGYNDELPISPISDFRNDDISVGNIDPCKFFSRKQERFAETNMLNETSNSSILHKLLCDRVLGQNSNYFANESTPSLTTTVNVSPLQSYFSDIEINHHRQSVQESYDFDSPTDNFKSISVKNSNALDVLENSVIDLAEHKLPERFETNENLASSKTLNKRVQKSISQTDELPNSITSVRPHFTCYYCGKSYLKKTGLIYHIKAHMSSGQSFHCEKCGKSFAAKRREQKLVKCPNCDVRYNTRNQKHKLLEVLETNENLPSSKTSNKRMQKSISQTDELPNSITPVQSHFTRDICGKPLLRKSGRICSQSFRCKKCGKSFVAKRRGQKLVKCPNCDVRYKTRSQKNKFESISNSLETEKKCGSTVDSGHREPECGNSNVHCGICGKSCSSNSAVKKHIHQVYEEKRHECTTCGKRFAQKGHLKKHAVVHGSDKPFKCSICNACFKFPNSKRRHEKMVHDGYAPFHCAHCDKRCGQKNDLISHIFTQHFSRTQKQFKCAICDKSFALSQHLKRHRFVHMSQRPFKCSICDQRFKHLRNKSFHERKIHGKSDRFYCAHCKKVYSYKSDLSRHLKKVHV